MRSSSTTITWARRTIILTSKSKLKKFSLCLKNSSMIFLKF